MVISINKDKLEVNKKLFTDEAYTALLKMIEDSDNKLYAYNIDKNHIGVAKNPKDQMLLKVHRELIILNEIPARQYDAAHSDVSDMSDVYIDFRFERLFQNDHAMYIKYFQQYMSGKGIYAPLKNGQYIKITPTLLKKTKKETIHNQDYILPNTWIKYAKIIKSKD